MTVNELQQYRSFQVTEKGYAMEQNCKPQPAGPTFNISGSTIDQLAAVTSTT